MPASKDAPPPSDTTTTEAPASSGASPTPEPPAATPSTGGKPPTGRLDPGVYEYTAPFTTVYGVPLTAHPPIPGEDGTPDQPATVFDWFEGAPDDGRWATTRKKPNQTADNMPPESKG